MQEYEDDKKITFHDFETDFLYTVYGIKNDSGSTYVENTTFVKFEGMTLIAPYESQEYKITVDPSQIGLVLTRQNGSFSTSKQINRKLRLSNTDLINTCLAKGKKDIPMLHIKRYTYHHADGVI